MKTKNKILTALIILVSIITLVIFFYSLNEEKKNAYGLQPLKYEELIEKTENKEDFILIVSRTNCSHCNTYKPKVDELAKNHKIIVYYINTDTLSNKEEFLTEFNLSGVTPVTMLFKEGKETTVLNRLEGDLATKKVKEKFKEMGFID